MVKNTVGGKKGKMMANKNGSGSGSGSSGSKHLRLVEEPGIEMMVCVTKVFGGGLFEVIDNDELKYRAFLRGKMKGHNKRHNLVALFSILLVAKRIDTDPNKCDILFVYDSHDIQFMALNPTLKIHNLLSFHNNHSFSNDNTTNIYNTNNDSDDILFNNFEQPDTLDIDNKLKHHQNEHMDKDKDKDNDLNKEDIDFNLI
jgi:hypothetical protein